MVNIYLQEELSNMLVLEIFILGCIGFTVLTATDLIANVIKDIRQ